jgi:hypothetical protein
MRQSLQRTMQVDPNVTTRLLHSTKLIHDRGRCTLRAEPAAFFSAIDMEPSR